MPQTHSIEVREAFFHDYLDTLRSQSPQPFVLYNLLGTGRPNANKLIRFLREDLGFLTLVEPGTARKRCSCDLKPIVLALARLFAVPACCMNTCLAPVIAV